jgi:hypothetical protein
VVHRAINALIIPAVKLGQPVDQEQVVRQALALAQRQLAFSAARQYRASGLTKSAAGADFCAIYDHEHGRELSPDRLQRAFESIAMCLRNLCHRTGFLGRLYEGYSHRVELPLTFQLDGTTVSYYVDLLYYRAPQRPVIVDWKVSLKSSADHERQLLVYALAFLRSPLNVGTPEEALELYEVNLLLDRVTRHVITAEKLARTEDFVLKSADALQTLTEGKAYLHLDLEDFEYARSEKSCQHCRFLSLCREV